MQRRGPPLRQHSCHVEHSPNSWTSPGMDRNMCISRFFRRCYRCGHPYTQNHLSSCPATRSACFQCGKLGHFSRLFFLSKCRFTSACWDWSCVAWVYAASPTELEFTEQWTGNSWNDCDIPKTRWQTEEEVQVRRQKSHAMRGACLADRTPVLL